MVWFTCNISFISKTLIPSAIRQKSDEFTRSNSSTYLIDPPLFLLIICTDVLNHWPVSFLFDNEFRIFFKPRNDKPLMVSFIADVQIWTAWAENVPSGMCAQQRFRSACAFALLVAKNAKFLHADNEGSEETARMRRLIWIFVRRTCQKLRFPY